MKSKTILWLALALSGGLLSCSTAIERPTEISNFPDGGTYISEIHMIDVRNGWAWSSRGTEDSDLLLHTTDGGRTWQDRTPRALPYVSEGSCFLDSQIAWVSTLDRKTDVGGLLRTTNGGKTWSVLIRQGTAAYGGFTEMSGLHFSNARDGVARVADGSAGSTWFRFFETHNGGKDWQPIAIIPPGASYAPPGAAIGISDIAPESLGYCPPANVVITHGDLDDEKPKDAIRISLSTNLGESWRDLRLPLPSEKYREGLVECDTPVFLDDKNGWLPAHIVKYGGGYTFKWNVLAFYITRDRGETWRPRPGIIEGGTNLVGGYGQYDMVSSRDIFVCNGTNLSVTHDGARTWRTIRPNIDFDRTSSRGGVLQIDFVEATHGWAALYDTVDDSHNKYYLYKTSDGGKTWTELPLRISR
jgi:photosystem II stability/assembly factor-like uncharacterized protein